MAQRLVTRFRHGAERGDLWSESDWIEPCSAAARRPR